MSATEAVPCVLCAALARRWRDQHDRPHGSRIYRCAVCGGCFAITGDALVALEENRWDATGLLAAVRQCIEVGKLPRIEEVDGRPRVVAVARQAY
ncbi:hypothetical protein DN412_32120 [Cupriavidus lacunae]|uniref:Uncharacterized protein n=1 Tax=Cupriavidus lacunae TaxID=2666307 RepID=A0A370NL27_9BURK|nr:hypothetical protein DN412_32120 [Cupriavidus lacunae]